MSQSCAGVDYRSNNSGATRNPKTYLNFANILLSSNL